VNTGKEFSRKGNANLWPWVLSSKDILGSATPEKAAAAR
jgi:hypothetical protein